MLSTDLNHLPSVCKDLAAHYGQSWRVDTAPGKPLTNHTITKRMKEGYYGRAAQQAALARTASKNNFVDRCACGVTLGVRWYEYKYLPQHAFLCPACLEKARGFRVKIKSAGITKRNLNEFA